MTGCSRLGREGKRHKENLVWDKRRGRASTQLISPAKSPAPHTTALLPPGQWHTGSIPSYCPLPPQPQASQKEWMGGTPAACWGGGRLQQRLSKGESLLLQYPLRLLLPHLCPS